MSTTSSLSMSSAGTDGVPQSIEYQKQPSNSNQPEEKLEGIFREKLNLKDNTTTTTTSTTNKETKKYPSRKSAPSKDKSQQQQQTQPLPQPKKKKEYKSVPYFVLNLTNGKTKALFTVPQNYAHSMCINPVLCRGSSFQLKIDIVSQERFQTTTQQEQDQQDTNDAAEGKDSSKVAAAAASGTATTTTTSSSTTTNTTTTTTILPPSSSTSFISTEYYSPQPEETALHIAQRLAIRMDGDGLLSGGGSGGILPF